MRYSVYDIELVILILINIETQNSSYISNNKIAEILEKIFVIKLQKKTIDISKFAILL